MTIPMVIRLKHLFSMSEKQREKAQAIIEAAYNDAKARSVPLVIGDHVDVLWPVERWEHKIVHYGGFEDIHTALEELEPGGWQLVSIDGVYHNMVFKRPAREEG